MGFLVRFLIITSIYTDVRFVLYTNITSKTMIDCICKQNFSFDSQRTKITLSQLSFHLLFCKLFDEKLMNNNNLLSTFDTVHSSSSRQLCCGEKDLQKLGESRRGLKI